MIPCILWGGVTLIERANVPNRSFLKPSIESSSISVALISRNLSKFLSSLENIKNTGILFLERMSLIFSKAYVALVAFYSSTNLTASIGGDFWTSANFSNLIEDYFSTARFLNYSSIYSSLWVLSKRSGLDLIMASAFTWLALALVYGITPKVREAINFDFFPISFPAIKSDILTCIYLA